ncbi:MAG: VWA domain-containing protein [Chloroflexota bacterium]
MSTLSIIPQQPFDPLTSAFPDPILQETPYLTHSPPKGNLLRNCVHFGRLLRALGVEVTPTQMVDLVDSLYHVEIANKYDFKFSAQAVLINRREHLAIFHEAFELFWQARDEHELQEIDLSSMFSPVEPDPNEQQQQLAEPDQDEGGTEGQEDEEMEIEQVFTYSAREILREKDFGKLTDEEMVELRRLMLQTEWNLSERRTRRVTPDANGFQLDMRRTLRQNLRYGGEPLSLARRKRKTKRRPLVVICDISGSMERYSRVLLQFIYAITSEVDTVEAFAFGTRLTRITRQLQSRDVDKALGEASAVINDWAGGTRIGESIRSFNYEWGRRVLGQGAVVLIISDGWDRGDINLLGKEMDRLHRSCHQLIWLNPLLGSENYEPLVRGIQAALPHIDNFMPVHNLASLEQLAEFFENGLKN